MKTKPLFSFTFIIALLCISKETIGNNTIINQQGPGLEISSMLSYNGMFLSNYKVIIYNENQISDTLVVTREKTLFLKLSYGHSYSIRYIKPGYLERIVMIDTKLIEENKSKDLGFDFEIEMIPAQKTGNTISNLPVAVIQYDSSEHEFDYSRTYHRQVRGKDMKETDVAQ